MKIYNTKLTMQNFGSAFLVILRGTVEDVNETFNSFYNLCGVSERAQIDISENATDAVGTFWTTDALLRRYWANRFLAMNPSVKEKVVYAGIHEDANLFIISNINEMRKNSEAFMNFDKNYFEEPHSLGKISAESPDLDFKDAVVSHAFKPKTEVSEVVETDVEQ